LSLTRQNLNPVRTEHSKENKCAFGAYEVLRTKESINLTIIATGSEVELAIQSAQELSKQNIFCKVISMPCQELFNIQNESYKNKILNETNAKISIEAGSTFGWKKYTGNLGKELGIDSFGKSAPYKKVYEHFKLTSNNVIKRETKSTLLRSVSIDYHYFIPSEEEWEVALRSQKQEVQTFGDYEITSSKSSVMRWGINEYTLADTGKCLSVFKKQIKDVKDIIYTSSQGFYSNYLYYGGGKQVSLKRKRSIQKHSIRLARRKKL